MEEELGAKFNDWVRNRVDDIDPSDPNSLPEFFMLQRVQRTQAYEDLVDPDTHEYKEEQMRERFNDWVRNRVDDIDPTDPNSLPDFFKLQKVQWTEKYDELATTDTHEYKEEQMKKKFNEYIENLVNGLDPNDPNFEEELEKLRLIQRSDKYSRLITQLMHQWKEEQLKVKFGQYVGNLVDALDPSLANFMENLNELIQLQKSETYQELCPAEVKQAKNEQIKVKVTEEPGEIPKVRGTLPGYEQTDVPVSQSVLIAFDQPMEPLSVMETFEVHPAVEGHLEWLESNAIMLFEPLEFWDFDATYEIYIGMGAMSEAGMLMEEAYEFGFTTGESGEVPRVVGTLPHDGQADASGTQPIEIYFDQPMTPASLEAAIEVSPALDYAILWAEDNTIARLHPLAPLGNNAAYTVDIGTEAMSAGGLPLAEGHRFSFITGILPTPHVLGTLPLDGQVDVPPNHPIRIVFDWPMEPASVEATLEVSPGVEYSTTWLEANFVLLIETTEPLATKTIYIFEIGTTAMSTDGLPLEEGFRFSFITGE